MTSTIIPHCDQTSTILSLPSHDPLMTHSHVIVLDKVRQSTDFGAAPAQNPSEFNDAWAKFEGRQHMLATGSYIQETCPPSKISAAGVEGIDKARAKLMAKMAELDSMKEDLLKGEEPVPAASGLSFTASHSHCQP